MARTGEMTGERTEQPLQTATRLSQKSRVNAVRLALHADQRTGSCRCVHLGNRHSQKKDRSSSQWLSNKIQGSGLPALEADSVLIQKGNDRKTKRNPNHREATSDFTHPQQQEYSPSAGDHGEGPRQIGRPHRGIDGGVLPQRDVPRVEDLQVPSLDPIASAAPENQGARSHKGGPKNGPGVFSPWVSVPGFPRALVAPFSTGALGFGSLGWSLSNQQQQGALGNRHALISQWEWVDLEEHAQAGSYQQLVYKAACLC